MKTKTIIMLSKAAIVALFFCALFYVARPINAKADTDISGPNNYTSNMQNGDLLTLVGDTTIFIDEDLEIHQISGSYDLTIEGDGIHTLTIKEYAILCKNFIMQSGKLYIYDTINSSASLNTTGDVVVNAGTLVATLDGSPCIDGNILVDGGNIKFTSLSSAPNVAAFSCSGNMTITGGTVEACGTSYGLATDYNGNINISGENTIVKARATNSTGRAIDAAGTLTIAPELTVTKPRGGGVSSDGKFLATVSGGSVGATDVEIRKFIPDAPEDNEEEPVDDTPTPNYFDDLTSMLEIAKEAGGAQTIYWNEGTALPGPVMKFLSENPQITLVFSYTYEGLDYTVTIPGKNVKYDPNIPWCGPLYLYGMYGRYSASTPVKTTNSTLTLGNRTYTITSGDSLWDIARRLGITVDELVRINNVKNPDKIDIGQIIKY